jgi:glycosyltransferase involved in cell wall biosynthesis
MRACMVAYTFYEGDNRVRRYGEALVRRGDEVDAFTLRQQGSPSTATVRGVTVHKIQKRIPNEKRSFDYLVRLLVFLVKSTVFLTRHHFRKKYDLIHVHSVPDFEVFAALIAKLTGAKVILDIHDAVPELYSGKFRVSRDSALFRLLVFAERLSGGFADHVIIANDIWRDRIALRSISPSKCSVILNYPDPDIFHRRVSTRKNLDKLVLLYPGTLSKHQGIAKIGRAHV